MPHKGGDGGVVSVGLVVSVGSAVGSGSSVSSVAFGSSVSSVPSVGSVVLGSSVGSGVVVTLIQQSCRLLHQVSPVEKSRRQLLRPHIRPSAHSLSLLQSPSP